MEAPSSSKDGASRGASVRLINVSASATLADLYGHFSVAGTISSIHLQRSSHGGPTVAHVTFAEESAMSTALLLSESAIKGSMVTVQGADRGYTPPPDAKFYLCSSTPVKPAVVVQVSNVSPSTTDQDLQDFFAFAGSVCCIYLPPVLDDAPRDAYVGFYEQAALENALLLTDAKVKGNILAITEAQTYQPPLDAKFFPREGAQVMASPAQQAQAMVQRMIEGGYTLGASAALQARQFDERHRLSETASVRAEELRQSAAAAVADLQKRLSEGREAISRSFQKRTTDSADYTRADRAESEKREEPGGRSQDAQASAQPLSHPQSQSESQPQSQGFLYVAQQRVSDMGSYFSRSSASYREYLASAAARISSGTGQTSRVASEPDAEPKPGSAGSEKSLEWLRSDTSVGAGIVTGTGSGEAERAHRERGTPVRGSGFVKADLSAAAAATPPRRIGTPLGSRGDMDDSPLFYKDELPTSLAPSSRTPPRNVTLEDSRNVTVAEYRDATVSEFREVTVADSPGALKDELPTSLGPSIKTPLQGVTVPGGDSPGRLKRVTVTEGSPGRLKEGRGSPGGLPGSTVTGDSMSKGAIDSRLVNASRAAARKAVQQVSRKKMLFPNNDSPVF